jgi:hypothetical protein
MRKDTLKDSGIFGEHILSKIEQGSETRGSISGNFFFGSGSIAGSMNSGRTLQFYWQPKPKEIISTNLSYGKFKFVIDDTKDVPTVEFVFTRTFLDGELSETSQLEEMSRHPNHFIQNELHLNYALVRISQKTMEQEIYLPKP